MELIARRVIPRLAPKSCQQMQDFWITEDVRQPMCSCTSDFTWIIKPEPEIQRCSTHSISILSPIREENENAMLFDTYR